MVKVKPVNRAKAFNSLFEIQVTAGTLSGLFKDLLSILFLRFGRGRRWRSVSPGSGHFQFSF